VARRRQDPKVAALREQRSLNPRPGDVADEAFGSSEFFDARDLVQVKYEMVRRVRVDRVPVSRAAAAFGFSRPSFYQAAAAVDAHGLAGLAPARPGPRRAHKLTEEIVAFARAQRETEPGLRSAELAARIADQFGISVHPRSVERALARVRKSKSGGRQ
jgi:transposase